MATLRTRLATVAVAFAVTLTGLVPAQAFQAPAPAVAAASNTPVVDVQYRRDWDRRHDRRGWYNGHRGYRDRRPGYRYHNGMWFPLAAFATGAIIGGAVQQDRVRGGYSSAHYRWCEQRYRSYRASDNTYVPRAGVRASCNSPY